MPNLNQFSVAKTVFNPVLAFLTVEPASDDTSNNDSASQFVATTPDPVNNTDTDDDGSTSSPAKLLSGADFDTLLQHQRGSLRAKFAQLHAVLKTPAEDPGLRTTVEGEVIVSCHALVEVWAAQYKAVRAMEVRLFLKRFYQCSSLSFWICAVHHCIP